VNRLLRPFGLKFAPWKDDLPRPQLLPPALGPFFTALASGEAPLCASHFFDEPSERIVRLRIQHPRDQPVVMLNLLLEFDTLFTHGTFHYCAKSTPVSR
jgi:hypothetical protein